MQFYMELTTSLGCFQYFYKRLIFLVYVSIFLIRSTQGGPGSLTVTMTATPSQPVQVGDSVELLCHLNGSFDRSFSVTWRHGDKGPIYGEQCDSFRKGYTISCWPGTYNTANYFKFVIKSVKWSDRGIWRCALNFNGSTINLRVHSPAPITSLNPLPRLNGRLLEGAGTRTNPYNLYSANLTQFECNSGCGYPAPNIEWTFSNKTSAGSLNRFLSGTEIRPCSGDQKGMTTSRSVFNVKNCTEMGLTGHLQVTCTFRGPQYKQPQSRSFYIVCPGLSTSQPYGGMPALTLTHGEVIGIAVGCAIALILTFLSVIWFHRKRLKAHRHNSV